jgi:hypothetical protein
MWNFLVYICPTTLTEERAFPRTPQPYAPRRGLAGNVGNRV